MSQATLQRNWGGGFPFAATDYCYCRSVSAVAAVSLLSHLLWLLSFLAQPRLLKERGVSRDFKRRHQPRRELREGIVDGAEMRYKHAQESPVHMQLCPVTFISKITYSTSPFPPCVQQACRLDSGDHHLLHSRITCTDFSAQPLPGRPLARAHAGLRPRTNAVLETLSDRAGVDVEK